MVLIEECWAEGEYQDAGKLHLIRQLYETKIRQDFIGSHQAGVAIVDIACKESSGCSNDNSSGRLDDYSIQPMLTFDPRSNHGL